MQFAFSSTLLLTILLAIGLFFFLRAASKDRTTVIEIGSTLPALEVLPEISQWLESRGWRGDGGSASKQTLRFHGSVSSSTGLAIFLSLLGGCGSASLGLVIKQLIPALSWWPLLLSLIGGPLAGFIYKKKSERDELFELKLVDDNEGTLIKLKAHRDELIALDVELSKKLNLVSDGSLFKTPI